MKNTIIVAVLLFSFNFLKAQISEDLLVNIHSVSSAEMNSLNPSSGSLVFNTTTKVVHVYDGGSWKEINNKHTYGDIKSGIQQNDHSGWVKLDGRAITSLTTTQQTQATALGLSTNLPNANNTYLSQNGTTLGSVSGNNTKTIARNQLPLFTLGGTTSTNGNHTYVGINGSYATNSNRSPRAGDWARIISVGTIGNHNHTITTNNINNTGTQQTLDTTPATLSVTMFIYLGV